MGIFSTDEQSNPYDTQRIEQLEAEVARLRTRLLSAAGDDLCRLSQEEIKAYTSGAVQIPPRSEFIPSCERFHEQISNSAGVLTSCLTLAQLVAENQKQTNRIEELESENKRLSDIVQYRNRIDGGQCG